MTDTAKLESGYTLRGVVQKKKNLPFVLFYYHCNSVHTGTRSADQETASWHTISRSRNSIMLPRVAINRQNEMLCLTHLISSHCLGGFRDIFCFETVILISKTPHNTAVIPNATDCGTIPSLTPSENSASTLSRTLSTEIHSQQDTIITCMRYVYGKERRAS